MVNKQICFINLEKVLVRPASGNIAPEDWADFRLNLKVLNKLFEKYDIKYLFIYSTEDTNLNCSDYGLRIQNIADMCYNWYMEKYTLEALYIDYTYFPMSNKEYSLEDQETLFNTFLGNYNLLNYPKDSMFILGNSIRDRKFSEYYKVDYVTLNSF